MEPKTKQSLVVTVVGVSLFVVLMNFSAVIEFAGINWEQIMQSISASFGQQARTEKMNCLSDSPKNILSV